MPRIIKPAVGSFTASNITIDYYNIIFMWRVNISLIENWEGVKKYELIPN